MSEDLRNLECEIMTFERGKKSWVSIACSERRAQDSNEVRRCPECHGRVIVMKAGPASPAHFEHRPRHNGYSHSILFDGHKRANPNPLE